MLHRGSESPACYDVWLATFHITERLYDTPYPDAAQNDLQPEKTERNEEMRQRYLQGELIHRLANEFGISVQRVSEIIRIGRRKGCL